MRTLIYNLNYTDAALNLALEEYCLNNLDATAADYIILYINAPTVVVGKNQNIFEEINQGFVAQNDIKVVRRPTGGGAVYHDLGNLNFATISPYTPEKFLNFNYFNTPIIHALQAMNIPAAHNHRYDIIVNQKKISGSAQQSTKKNILSHGTLLFDANLDVLNQILRPQAQKITSNSLKSVRSTVDNIKNYAPRITNINAFKIEIIRHLNINKTLHLSPDEWQVIEKIANEKYRTWAWNYAKSPPCTIQKSHKNLHANIAINKGCVVQIIIDGLDENIQNILQNSLQNQPYTHDVIQQIIDKNVQNATLIIDLMELLY